MTVSNYSRKAWLYVGGSAIVLFAGAGILPLLLYSGSNGEPESKTLQRPTTISTEAAPTSSPATNPSPEVVSEGLMLPTN